MPLKRETERRGVRSEKETFPCITFSTLEFYSMGVSYLFLNVLAFHCPDTLVMVSPYWLLVTPLRLFLSQSAKILARTALLLKLRTTFFLYEAPRLRASSERTERTWQSCSQASCSPCRHQEQLVGRGSSCLQTPFPPLLYQLLFPTVALPWV